MTLEKDLQEKVNKYEKLTEQALKEIKKMHNLTNEQEQIADDYLSMTKNYLFDGKHYKEKGELLIALASFSYAHAWLDAGVRAGIFKADNRDLFTLRE